MLTRKNNFTLYLDENLVKEAKSLGFNLSRLMENRLKEVLAKADTPRGSSWKNRNLPEN